MSVYGKHGVTKDTPKNVLFGAGTIHRDLKFEGGSWNFAESIVGATSGGSKLDVVPVITEIEIDGALVPVKLLTNQKTGETATMEINFIELTDDVMKAALIAESGNSEDASYSLLESKGSIEAGDYWDNVAFVGKNLEGENIIAILPNALCTSGLSLDSKNKEASKPAVTFVCTAELEGDLDKLPWKIYKPTKSA